MATSQTSDLPRSAHGCSSSVLINCIAPYQIRDTTENHVHGTANAQKRDAAPPNPSTLYKTYFDPNIQRLGEHDCFESDNDCYTCDSGVVAGHNVSVTNAQPQLEGHAAAYKFAVRLSNRSNGAPLATIIEQGSHSTLNSHGSLLSVGRFPSTKAADIMSTTRGSGRRSHSLDEKALHDIEEDLARELETSVMAAPHARLGKQQAVADPRSGNATPLTSSRFEARQSPLCYSGDELCDQRDRRAKGFIRGVLQNMRGVSRARSRSSSSTHAPITEHCNSPVSTSERSAQIYQQGQRTEFARASQSNCDTSTFPTKGAAVPSGVEHQTRSHATPSPIVELPDCTHPLSVQSRSETANPGVGPEVIRPVSTHQGTTCSHKLSFLTPLARAGTRDVVQECLTSQTSTSHHDMFDNSASYTFNGVPIYHEHLSSDEVRTNASDVFTNQNASFCSTMSTSYSGTVLGIDLDLQHDFSHPTFRSQSPPEPVWFTPQMAELLGQASLSESPETVKKNVPNQGQHCSITSSALTSLLPIAAATGIVQPNYNTPTISFYSPSGNLIQSENSSPQSTGPSEYCGSPKTRTSFYNRSNSISGASGRIRPARPPPIPMSTTPAQKTRIPLHLRHHHNYQHLDLSKLSSCTSLITPKGPVKGCDGVVRENSITPRSGVFHPCTKDKVHRSAKVILDDLKAETKFYKARFLASAAAQSFVPPMPKRMALQKRYSHHHDTYAKKPYVAHNRENYEGRSREDVLGSFTAHALRVCFCQPYDGAGNSTRANAARSCMAGEPLPKNGKLRGDQCAKDAELLLPNARVIAARTKRATRGDGASGSPTQRASHTRTAKLKAN